MLLKYYLQDPINFEYYLSKYAPNIDKNPGVLGICNQERQRVWDMLYPIPYLLISGYQSRSPGIGTKLCTPLTAAVASLFTSDNYEF